ncbi:cytochrome P450 [Neoaquamicrobium sediminum]|uniref:cytochrome P450 n=1 Tax=Neoaquamicrobium sediminum TaxID=1849104 RepID=UPI001FD4F6DE|nr:cytochrome P450 [Mesorhizobium sediminum]
MPERIRRTLIGRGGVQGLDDAEHQHRKQMFMSLMTPERIGELAETVLHWMRAYSRNWAAMDRVKLGDELPEILTRAACAWSGIALEEREVETRTRQLTAMFSYAGSVGPKHWWSRLARKRTERWIGDLVVRVRAGELTAPESSAMHVISFHNDLQGRHLSPTVAAVEILNILRPIVAVSVYLQFLAHALHMHPPGIPSDTSAGARHREAFVQEVRRYYPFFPAVAAVVRESFEWKGYRFAKGRRVMLDLYGTNRDRRTWDAPGEFRPERFDGIQPRPFAFVPQGGGDHDLGHRCAGEWICIELMKAAMGFLTEEIAYDVPEQDLRIEMRRLPAVPRSGFVIQNVSRA